MNQSNQSEVMTFGPNKELLVYHNGRLSLAPAVRQNLTVARSINEAVRGNEGRSLRGMYPKDYVYHYRTANFLCHEVFLKQAWGNIENEIAVLWLCSSFEHIVDLYKVYQANPIVPPALIMRYVPGVSLQEMLRRQRVNRYVPEQNVKRVIRDILRALGSLHRFNIAHLDLKPKKVLLLGGRFGEGVKLCGFRFARLMYGEVLAVRNITIDREYKAPELLRLEAVSLATDIWSVGTMAYVMMTSRNVRGPIAFANSRRRRMSAQAIDFIDQCRGQQSDRPTVAQCLAHPWLADAPAHE